MIICVSLGRTKHNMELSKKHFMLISFFIIFSSLGIEATKEPPRTGKHFVLIHGSCLGAWSWYKLVTLLKSSGHNVTALDLAASGINPLQANDLQSSFDYFKPLRDFMEALPSHERVILVGHSLGGLAISQAMEYFPSKISVAVFVTALMPGPTLNISTLNQMSFSQQALCLTVTIHMTKAQTIRQPLSSSGPCTWHQMCSNLAQLR
ncbi:hypothetical protein SO802_028500 [Lithocarpus litseifolius]|uniref:AB hydrolase-1 domain-containing protein n=1 Tax=Lithocarpus litseifolius TaxID=425828 RepID=A0AAW2BQG3_9ROSI